MVWLNSSYLIESKPSKTVLLCSKIIFSNTLLSSGNLLLYMVTPLDKWPSTSINSINITLTCSSPTIVTFIATTGFSTFTWKLWRLWWTGYKPLIQYKAGNLSSEYAIRWSMLSITWDKSSPVSSTTVSDFTSYSIYGNLCTQRAIGH